MAVPKRRHSKSRSRTKRAGWKAKAPTLVSCAQCQAKMLPHRVCQECGYYKSEKVIEVKS